MVKRRVINGFWIQQIAQASGYHTILTLIHLFWMDIVINRGHRPAYMHISVIGSGYVGTTIAACFADLGHHATNVDIDQSIVDEINAGNAPIHE